MLAGQVNCAQLINHKHFTRLPSKLHLICTFYVKSPNSQINIMGSVSDLAEQNHKNTSMCSINNNIPGTHNSIQSPFSMESHEMHRGSEPISVLITWNKESWLHFGLQSFIFYINVFNSQFEFIVLQIVV